MSFYEVAILGSVTDRERETLASTLHSMIGDFGMAVGAGVVIYNAATLAGRDKHAAFAAAYFGGDPTTDDEVVRELMHASVPIIPTVAANGDFGAQIPDLLRRRMGCDAVTMILS